MPTTTDTLTWLAALDAFDVDWTSPVLVVGWEAASLAEECTRRGAAGIAVEGAGWVLLASEVPAGGPGSWTDLPAGAAGTVVVRRAWQHRAALGGVLRDAAIRVAPGGRLVAADLDAVRLLEGSPVHYPYRLRFTLDPDAAARFRAEAVSAADLAIAVGRAGMTGVVGVTVDEVRGCYSGAADYWTAVRDGAWPSLAETPPERRASLLEGLAAALGKIAPLGGLVERRPWFVATGLRR